MPQLCIIPSRALADPEMTPRQLRALLAVGHFTSRDGSGVWASNATLAEVSRMDERDFRRALAELVKRGYVRKVHRTREGGGSSTAMMAILLDEPLRGEGQNTPGGEGRFTPGEEGRSTPPNDPEERPHLPTTVITAHLDVDARIAYDGIRQKHPNPVALDHRLRGLAEPLGGNGYGWDAVGLALCQLWGNGEEWNEGRMMGYLRRLKQEKYRGVPASGMSRQDQNLAAIADGLRLYREVSGNGE